MEQQIAIAQRFDHEGLRQVQWFYRECLCQVEHFDHEGLRQVERFNQEGIRKVQVPDKDFLGQNIVLLHSTVLHEMLNITNDI